MPKNAKDIQREIIQEKKERHRIASASIYSITTTRYNYLFGRIDTKGTVESVRRYNGSGYLTEETSYNQTDGSLVSRKTYRYDNRGNLTEENTNANGESIKTIHRYTPSNSKYETIFYKSDGTVDKKLTYVSDEHGRVLEIFGYLNDGRLYLRESLFYGNGGNIAERKNSLNKYVYMYTGENNIRTILKYARIFQASDSAQYTLTDRYEFAHDRSSHMIGMTLYKSDSVARSRFEYSVDADGRLTAEKEFTLENRLVYQRKIRYDKGGNIAEEWGSDRGNHFRMKYKYDAKGNRTEAVEYDQINEPKYLVKYSFGRSSSGWKQNAAAKSADSIAIDPNELINEEEFLPYIGGRLVAPDGAYLGMIVADSTDSQSIINSWGQYGFDESPTSIFNPAIPYGGTEGVFSPFNPSSPSPPSIYKEGKFFAYCTENENFRPRSSPAKLIAYLRMAAKRLH